MPTRPYGNGGSGTCGVVVPTGGSGPHGVIVPTGGNQGIAAP